MGCAAGDPAAAAACPVEGARGASCDGRREDRRRGRISGTAGPEQAQVPLAGRPRKTAAGAALLGCRPTRWQAGRSINATRPVLLTLQLIASRRRTTKKKKKMPEQALLCTGVLLNQISVTYDDMMNGYMRTITRIVLSCDFVTVSLLLLMAFIGPLFRRRGTLFYLRIDFSSHSSYTTGIQQRRPSMLIRARMRISLRNS